MSEPNTDNEVENSAEFAGAGEEGLSAPGFVLGVSVIGLCGLTGFRQGQQITRHRFSVRTESWIIGLPGRFSAERRHNLSQGFGTLFSAGIVALLAEISNRRVRTTGF